MFKLALEGVDEFILTLGNYEKQAAYFSGRQSVAVTELFPPEFMKIYTPHESIEALFSVGGYTIQSKQDLERIPENEWDTFIKANTGFEDWEEMMQTAAEEWIMRKLGIENSDEN